MSRIAWFCIGSTTALSVSQNFNHKKLWSNDNNPEYIITYPTGLKNGSLGISRIFYGYKNDFKHPL